ncbi:melanopsin-B-like isoform X2 [Artemia franciscana]
MTSYSSFKGRWVFGNAGCQIYGAGIGFFGLNSILTLAAIAWERYIVISAQPLNGKSRITRARARKVCIFLWAYVFILVIPPFFGWSSYHDEGIGTSCSWDYTSRTWNNRSYYFFLLTFGFIIPLIVITVSYGIMFATVVNSGNEIASMTVPSQRGSIRKTRRRSDIKTAQVIVFLILLFLIAWTPYAIVSAIGQFGSFSLSPIATSIPANCAKLLVVINPIVYGISHPRFRSSFTQYMCSLSSGSVYHAATPRFITPIIQQRKKLTNGQLSPPALRPSFVSDSVYYCGTYYHDCEHNTSFDRRCTRHSNSLHCETENHREKESNQSRNHSEPDFMRCDDRVIKGATKMAFTEYRIKKRSVIQKLFFRSETSLEVVRVSSPREIAQILYTNERRRKQELWRDKSLLPVPVQRRLSKKRESVLSPVADEGELKGSQCNVEKKASSSDREACEMMRTYSLKYRSGNLAMKQMERRNTYRRWSSERRRSRYFPKVKKTSSHINCCECAQIQLSQCVTIAKVPDGIGGSRIEVCLDTPSGISESGYL